MIKALLMDMDGCLTDGTYLVLSEDPSLIDKSSENNRRWKKFHTRDWQGINVLMKSGVKCAVITGDESTAIDNQVKQSNCSCSVFKGVKNKLDVARGWLDSHGISLQEAVFIGDDSPDAELLSEVGWPACPKDALNFIIHIVLNNNNGIVLARNGGAGCVRDLIEDIIEYNKRRRDFCE